MIEINIKCDKVNDAKELLDFFKKETKENMSLSAKVDNLSQQLQSVRNEKNAAQKHIQEMKKARHSEFMRKTEDSKFNPSLIQAQE